MYNEVKKIKFTKTSETLHSDFGIFRIEILFGISGLEFYSEFQNWNFIWNFGISFQKPITLAPVVTNLG